MLDRRRLAVAVGAVGLLGPGFARAAQTKFPDFPAPPPEKLKTSADSDLSVGVYVMDDLAEQKTYFDIELGKSAITPLWVSVANLAADRRFWFDVGEMKLSADKANFASGSASVNDQGATDLGIADLFVGSIVLGLIAQSMLTEASNIKKISSTAA